MRSLVSAFSIFHPIMRRSPMRFRGGVSILAVAVGLAAAASLVRAEDSDDVRRNTPGQSQPDDHGSRRDDDERDGLRAYKHIVVIYQENHSFDNLYGFWGKVGNDTINGQLAADTGHTVQVRQDNVTAYQ